MTTSNELELTTIEAAALLGLSPSTLRKWRSTREQPELPWRKRFSKVFYLESDVLVFKKNKTTFDSEDVFI